MRQVTLSHDPLSQRDLERLGEADSPEVIQRDLVRLVDHLDDSLVIVDQCPVHAGGTSRLVTFAVGDGLERRDLFALVGRDGMLRVGVVEDLSSSTTLHLEEFETAAHGLVSLAVTRKHRFLGDAWDVWVVVRTDSGQQDDPRGQDRAYHAILSMPGGRPSLAPCLEDFAPEPSRAPWHSDSADRLPLVLRQWNLQIAADTDPFEPLPDDCMQAIRDAEGHPSGRLEALAWAKGTLAVARAGRVHLPLAKGEPSLSPGDWTRTLALVPGRARGVVGTDRREIVAFAHKRGVLREEWRQSLGSFPSSLAFVSDSEGRGKPEPWPDLLAALEDGRVLRLRRLTPKALIDQWNELWRKLDLSRLESRYQALAAAAEDDEKWRETLWVGLLFRMRENATSASAASRSNWRQRLVEALLRESSPSVLKKIAEILVESVGSSSVLGSSTEPAAGLLLDVLHDAYSSNLQIQFQDRVDQCVRGLHPPAESAGDVRLRALAERAENTRQKVWRDRPRRPEDPLTAIRYSEFGLERWSSPYLLADSRLLPSLRDRVWTGLACLGEGVEESYLAAASIASIAVHRIDGDMLVEADAAASHTLDREGIQALTTLPTPERDRLLVAGASGRLYLLGFEPGDDSLPQLATWGETEETLGSAWSLAAVPDADRGCTIAAAYNYDRRSVLVFLRLANGRLTELSRSALPLVRVRNLDLVRTRSGYRLLAGSVHGSPTAVFTLDEQGRPLPCDEHGRAKDPCWFRVLRTGASALRYVDGERFVVGERMGLLWCGRAIRDARVEDLLWTFDLDSAVRAAESVRVNGRPHVLAGSEDGWLVLLDADDGRRVWEHRYPHPIRAIRALATTAGDGAVIALQGGRVAVLSTDHDRDEALGEVRGYLKGLLGSTSFDPETDWHASAEGSRAFFLLEHRGEPFASVLRGTRYRRNRARLVRYLAQVIAPRDTRTLQQLLPDFKLVELMLLLAYGPQERSAWDDDVWRKVKEYSLGAPSEPEGALRRRMAAVAFLQRLVRREPGLEAIRRAIPTADLLDFPWVRLEFARHLLAAARKAARRQRNQSSLLAQTTKCLLELPPSVVDACAQALQFGSPAEREFKALAALVSALRRREVPRTDDLSTVVQGLRRGSSGEPVVLLITGILALQESCLGWPDERWGQVREGVLARLVELVRAARDPVHASLRTDPLSSGLRAYLGNDEIPVGAVRLAEQLRWYEQLGRRLISPRTPRRTSDGDWSEILSALLAWVRDLLDRISRLETVRLLKIVRPWVEVLESRRDETNRLVLRLRLVPEGSRQLKDVTILVDAGRQPGGLQAVSGTSDRRDLATYPDGVSIWEPVLSGYLGPDQGTVVVRVEITDETGYELKEDWRFPVPPPPFQITSHGFLASLPKTFRTFVQDLLRSRAAVALAVLDADMSFESFSTSWLEQSKGRLLDLDESLREFGAGRRYDAQPLTLEMIERRVLEAAGDTTAPPLLVAPTRELIQRLIDGEAPGVLEGFAGWLRQRAKTGARPTLIVAVDSSHACLLRSLGLGEIEEIAVDRLWRPSGPADKRAGTLREEAVELVAREEDLESAAARQRLEELVWDPRWLLRWLRWSRSDKEHRREGVAGFFAQSDQEKLLRSELGSLSPHDLVCALVACQAVTSLDLRQVEAGQVAAETYRSTTRSGPAKVLQAAGAPFTERSLTALRSDLQPKSKVRVEGFGLIGAPEAAGSTLLGLARYPREDDRAEGLARLAGLGFGSNVAGIFRTVPPYRSFIQRLYERARPTKTESRDAAVYRALKGAQSSPLESLSLREAAAVPRNELQRLLGATAQDTRVLQRLARLYIGDSGDEPGELLSTLMRGVIRALEVDTVDMAERALCELPFPVFAVTPREPVMGARADAAEYVGWLRDGNPQATDLASRALEKVEGERQKAAKARADSPRPTNRDRRTSEEAEPRPSKLFLLGPGVDDLPFDPRRLVAVVRSHDLCHAASEGDLLAGIRRRSRGQLRLTARSPFQTAGALPPNSRLFVGRREELSFIESRVRSASILIIGSRRVGKTSLLNQVFGWAGEQADLVPIYVDLQGCRSRGEFLSRWRSQFRHSIPGAGKDLEETFQHFRQKGRLPIVLLNEIDGLAVHEPSFVETLRGFNDRELARFVMVGYSAIGELGNPSSPFFHFTQGDRFEGKALALTALSPEAAEDLLRLLSDSDLGIEWASEEDRLRSITLCLERSYRIPWVLQRYGQLLVEHLEKMRRATLSFDDVHYVIEREGQVVWRYFDTIDYAALGFAEEQRALRPGFKLLLFALARGRYFQGGQRAAILDPRLDDRSPLQQGLGFTVGEAQELWERTLHELLLGAEKVRVSRWIASLKLEEALRLLTLTLALEPDPFENGRYGFLLHILPKELYHQRERFGGTLDQGIIDLAIELLSQLKSDREELR